MALAPTANMGLQKAEPLVTAGPDWAQLLNDIVDILDLHDHSSGKGVRVSTSGLNIDEDLELNSNNLTETRSVRLEAQGAALVEASDLRCVYALGGDLYYNNSSGAAVQITSGTSVISSISGAFAAATPGGYPYSVTAGDAQRILLVDTSAARSIELPAATTAVMFCIKDVTGTAPTYNISLVPDGTDTIEGVNANYALKKASGWWFIVSDGVSKWFVGEADPSPIPAGSMQMYGGAAAPSGWILCDGSAVSRTTYANLFTAISTTFGVGDGSTTFNVPDMRQKFPIGKAASGTGSTLGGTGGTIDHTHSVPAHYHGLGTGADLNITSSGSHTHSIDHNHPQTLTSTDGTHSHLLFDNTTGGGEAAISNSNFARARTSVFVDVEDYEIKGIATSPAVALSGDAGAHNHFFDVPNFTGTSGATSHTHAVGNFSGRIGLVTGGVDGNSAMTSGTGNPPFLAVNYIIKT